MATKKISLNEFKNLVNQIIKEEFSNFYQGMNPKQAIEKATIDYNFAMKKNNESQANKIAGNLKSHLEAQNYDWKKDPYAVDILSDFV